MPVMKTGSFVDPVDAQVGGDADIDGIDQTIIDDDINAIVMTEQPVDQRLEALKAMRGELQARSHADFGGDMAALIEQLDTAISRLAENS